MECIDNVGNILNVGDEVLVLVPKSGTTYRKAIVKDFKNDYDGKYREVLIEYNDERYYCNKYRWNQKDNDVKFSTKTTKAWRYFNDIVKFKKSYIENS